MRAFCTTITDPRAEAVLGPYAELMARVRHWSFKQLHVLQRPLKDVKSEAVRRFDVTARQFNGVRFDLDQAVNAWRGGVEFRISDAKELIEATAARITRMTQQLEKATTERRRKSLEFRIRGKKQRLDILKGRVQSLELKLQAEIPKICFGGRRAQGAARGRDLGMAREARQHDLPGRIQGRRSSWEPISALGREESHAAPPRRAWWWLCHALWSEFPLWR